MRTLLVAVLLCAAWVPAASAFQSSQLFQTTTHDFGTVARAAKTEHRFIIDNPYSQPIHVRSVRTSCGCTTPIIETETIPVGGRGSILARFNTGTHSGARAATVTVTIDKPVFSEFQLHVKGYIRTDVVFQPGEAAFGTVMQGQSKSIEVALDYAGKPNWQVNNITCDDGFIQVQSSESSRQNGRVRYNVQVTILPSAPSGPLESELIVHTNDRNLTRVPLRLIANIVPEIAVSPSNLSLGDVTAGDPIKQIVMLKGQNPFRVLNIESDLFTIEVNSPLDESKPMHAIPMVLTPKPGTFGHDIQGKITFTTDLAEKPTLEIGTVFRLKTPIEQTAEPTIAPEPSNDTNENP